MCHQPLCQKEGEEKILSLCQMCVFLSRGRVGFLLQELPRLI